MYHCYFCGQLIIGERLCFKLPAQAVYVFFHKETDRDCYGDWQKARKGVYDGP